MRIWEKLRRIGVELYAFFTAPFVVRNCLSMIALTSVVLLFTFWWLKCYTHHGEKMEIPDFAGMLFRDAAKKARSQDFRVVINDSTYIAGKAPGIIIAQNPAAGSLVKDGRTIYFTITKSNPDIVKLPELAGADDYDLYARKLSRMGLNPRIVSRVSDPRYTEPNIIMAVLHNNDTITQKIKRGYSVEMGTIIDFVVSDQVSQTAHIPKCECETLGTAKFLIQSSKLSIGKIIPDGTVTDEETAYVYRQTPPYDENGIMRSGETVDLYITQDEPQKCKR